MTTAYIYVEHEILYTSYILRHDGDFGGLPTSDGDIEPGWHDITHIPIKFDEPGIARYSDLLCGFSDNYGRNMGHQYGTIANFIDRDGSQFRLFNRDAVDIVQVFGGECGEVDPLPGATGIEDVIKWLNSRSVKG